MSEGDDDQPVAVVSVGDYPLYLTEKEIAARVGVGERTWRATARILERSGLPVRDIMFAKRRYWPAVKLFLDRWNGMDGPLPGVRDGKENWD